MTTVQVAILTDGLADVQSVNGVAVDYITDASDPVKEIGGYVPSRLFLGNLTFGIGAGGHLTLTRANGSDLGSFLDEGFAVGPAHPDRWRGRRPQRRSSTS